MKNGRITATFWLLLILGYSTNLLSITDVHSENPIKEDIIDNCPRALLAARTLPTKEREDLIDYIIRVLALQDYQLSATLPDISDKGPGFNPASHEIKGPELSRVFEPGRETKAKQCALNVLKELGPHSWKALPTLIELASREKLSEEFRTELDRSIYLVSVSLAASEEIVPPKEFFASLKNLLLTKNSEYPENVFIELQRKCYDFLIEAYQNSGGEEEVKLRSLIVRLLKGMEPIGEVELSFVRSLTKARDPEIAGLSLSVLSKSGKLDSEHFSYLIQLAYDSPLPFRLKSLDLLGREKSRREKIISTFLSLLKGLPKDLDKQSRGEILMGISDALVDLEIKKKEAMPFVPYLLEAVEFGPSPWQEFEPHPATKVLLVLGEGAIGPLIKEIKSPNPRRRAAAGLVLGELRISKQTVIDALFTLVIDVHQGVREVSRKALSLFAPKVKSLLERKFDSSVPPSKLYYAEAVVSMSLENAKARRVLEQAFASGGCGEKVEYGKVLSKVPGGIGNDRLLPLVDCVKSDDDLALSALRVLGTLSSISDGAWERMWKLLPELKSSKPLQDELLITMSLIRPSSKELTDYFTAELASGDCERAIRLIPKLSSEAAMGVVNHALREIPPEKRTVAIRVAGDVGRVDNEMLQLIRSLTTSDDLEIVTEVTIALLKIDPSFPELASAVKRIASSRYSGEFSKETFPIEAQIVLETALSTAQSTLERTSLVSSMRG